MWRAWGAYGQCDVTCGYGVMVRRRRCNAARHGGLDCQGPAEQEARCRLPSCEGEVNPSKRQTLAHYVALLLSLIVHSHNNAVLECTFTLHCLHKHIYPTEHIID